MADILAVGSIESTRPLPPSASRMTASGAARSALVCADLLGRLLARNAASSWLPAGIRRQEMLDRPDCGQFNHLLGHLGQCGCRSSITYS